MAGEGDCVCMWYKFVAMHCLNYMHSWNIQHARNVE